MAKRVERDPYFLASAITIYMSSERLGDRELSTKLGCSCEILVLLRLCRRPGGDIEGFRHELELIASRFGVSPDVLAQIIRRADAIEALKQGDGSASGLLMAARDRSGGVAEDGSEHGGDPA